MVFFFQIRRHIGSAGEMKHKMKVTLNNMESTDNKKVSSLFMSASLNSKRRLSKLYIMLSFDSDVIPVFWLIRMSFSVALVLNRKVEEKFLVFSLNYSFPLSPLS